MARLYVADKETLDAVKADTTGILAQLQDKDGNSAMSSVMESRSTKQTAILTHASHICMMQQASHQQR